MKINIKPVQCTEEVMALLENHGVITRLMPGKNILETEPGESRHETLYSCDERYGPHKLITVTINGTKPKNFLYHNDREDFMLIDLPNREPLVLTVCLFNKEVLNKKIADQTLSADDFMSVLMESNHPQLSFFTMNPGFAHVETVLNTSDNPPSFYVAESRDLDENFIDLKNYELEIGK